MIGKAAKRSAPCEEFEAEIDVEDDGTIRISLRLANWSKPAVARIE